MTGRLDMRKISVLVLLLVLCSVMTGCGETVRGAYKDCQRIGSGLHTMIVCES